MAPREGWLVVPHLLGGLGEEEAHYGGVAAYAGQVQRDVALREEKNIGVAGDSWRHKQRFVTSHSSSTGLRILLHDKKCNLHGSFCFIRFLSEES